MAKKQIELVEQSVTEILQLINKLGPGIPSFIWGQPGIGKTAALKDTFKDFKVNLILAGCSEPTDISGVPFPYVVNGVNVATEILPPRWAYEASTKVPKNQQVPTVLFFDDLPTGHEQTQAACFKIFGEHKVGDLDIRDDVYVIAAGNRLSDKSATFEMPMALANRMKHYYAKCDNDAWIAWAIEHGIHPLVVGFMRMQPNALNRFEEIISSSSEEKAYATPRTWEILSKSMFILGPDGSVGNWLYPAAVGCVGAGTGFEFNTWAKNLRDLIRPEDIVKNPKKARIPGKTEIDCIFATISALEFYINQSQHHGHWKDALTYVLRDEMEPEYGLIIAKMAVTIAFNKLNEQDRVKAAQTKEFQEMYTRWGQYLSSQE